MVIKYVISKQGFMFELYHIAPFSPFMMFILRMTTAMFTGRMDGFQESGSNPKANFILNILATKAQEE